MLSYIEDTKMNNANASSNHMRNQGHYRTNENLSQSLTSLPQSSESKSSPQHSSTKNLSHVPCKFFKQGTCQLGNSCPFSHSLDLNLETTPCKYFQKGNCKFGVKCALLHILPDGRRVNPKSLQQLYQHQQEQLLLQQNYSRINGGRTYNNGMNVASMTSSSNSNSNSNANIEPISIHQNLKYQSSQSAASALPQANGGSSWSNSEYAHSSSALPMAQSSLQHSGSNSISNSGSFVKTSIWNNGTSSGNTTAVASNTTASTSIPTSSNTTTSPFQFHRTLSTPQHALSGLSRPSSSFLLQHSGSLILDDDEESKEEDFVPSSLSDLLTPQELQRRNSSRPGSSSSGVSGQMLQYLYTSYNSQQQQQGLGYLQHTQQPLLHHQLQSLLQSAPSASFNSTFQLQFRGSAGQNHFTGNPTHTSATPATTLHSSYPTSQFNSNLQLRNPLILEEQSEDIQFLMD